MNAQTFSNMCQFIGGKPMLIFRDHSEGRIKVHYKGEWIATVGPGHLLGIDQEAFVLFKNDSEDEFRASFGEIAYLLSEFQMNDGDIIAIYAADEMLRG